MTTTPTRVVLTDDQMLDLAAWLGSADATMPSREVGAGFIIEVWREVAGHFPVSSVSAWAIPEAQASVLLEALIRATEARGGATGPIFDWIDKGPSTFTSDTKEPT